MSENPKKPNTMEQDSKSSTPKISQKIKAAGAFRVFLNFLQRPSKKKDSSTSPESDENQPKIAASFTDSISTAFNQAETNQTQYFRSASYAGTTKSDLKKSLESITYPNVMALPEVSLKEIRQRVPDIPGHELIPQSTPANPRMKDDNDESDDEVFLDDSYFEDDYFEDFSSESSTPNKPQYSNHDPADFPDSFTYLNNLDKPNPGFDKDCYVKDFLDVNSAVYNSNCTPRNYTPPRRRVRHHSVPCELLRAATDELDYTPSLADSMFKNSKLQLHDTPAFSQLHSSISVQKGASKSKTDVVPDAGKSISNTPTKRNPYSSHDSKLEKEPRNLKQSYRKSTESGYGSARRLSTPSPASDFSSTTPMHRLHGGATVLSPQSLNALDGIPKPKRHLKRSLQPRFIFPPRSDPSKLKPVPEVLDSSRVPADQTQNRLSSGRKEVTCSLQVTKHEGLDINCNDIRTSRVTPREENATNEIRINLNVSVQGLDINNNLVDPLNDHARPSPHLQTSRDQSSPTVQTPLQRQEGHIGSLNVTPCAKLLTPICTSSPLHPALRNKTPVKNAHLENSLLYSSRKTEPTYYYKPKRPKTVSLTNTPRANTGSIRKNRSKSASERRKKFKKRSARTRLLFEDSNTAEEFEDFESVNRYQTSSSDYLLLKRIAESIIEMCPNRKLIDTWVDLPNLMTNLNIQYSKLIDLFVIESSPKLGNLAARLKSCKEIYENLASKNCIQSLLVALLIKDWKLTISSLDFAFENLPEVAKENDYFSFLAPEIVFLLLSNPRRIVKNSHGFPLSYSSSEMEVFKAVVKHVEAMQKTKPASFIFRAKNILSNVADSRVLWNKSSSPKKAHRDKIYNHGNLSNARKDWNDVRKSWNGDVRKGTSDDVRNSWNDDVNFNSAPRRSHRILFQRFSPFQKAVTNDYYVVPFISNSVQSLEDLASITGTTKLPEPSTPIHSSSLCHDYLCLRKLYFSYGRYNGLPYITKIGMQYSCKGKKKTYFVAQTPTTTYKRQTVSFGPPKYFELGRNARGRLEASKEMPESHKTQDVQYYADKSAKISETSTLVKKTAIVLKAGEHVKSLSVLGQSAVHNVEIVTNAGRRIRAHGIDVASDAGWVTIATPPPTSPYCLHAICGDVQKLPNRTYLRDIGAVWMLASPDTDAFGQV